MNLLGKILSVYFKFLPLKNGKVILRRMFFFVECDVNRDYFHLWRLESKM